MNGLAYGDVIGRNKFIAKCIANDIAKVRVNGLANVITKNGLDNCKANYIDNDICNG